MTEKYLLTVLEALGEKIDELKRTVRVLRYERDQLQERIDILTHKEKNDETI